MLFFLSHKALISIGLSVEWLGIIVIITYYLAYLIFPTYAIYLLIVAWLDIFILSRMLIKQKLTLKLQDFAIIYDTRQPTPTLKKLMVQVSEKDSIIQSIDNEHSEENQSSGSDLGSVTQSDDQ